MRIWKLIWVTAGAAALFTARPAAASPLTWVGCDYYQAWVTWYAPNSPYPYYFGPPYPYTSYLPSFYETPPFMTGLKVKEELIHMGVYPPPAPKDTLPPPKSSDKNPGVLPPPRPEDKNGDHLKHIHLQISLYELREAKQDVRQVKGLEPAERNEILGGIDSAIDQLKRTIEACGGKAEYIHPTDRPDYPDFKHLRHAVKELKEAKEQLKIQKDVPEDARDAGVQAIDKCLRHLDRALDRVK
jgi:hypothetical protein